MKPEQSSSAQQTPTTHLPPVSKGGKSAEPLPPENFPRPRPGSVLTQDPVVQDLETRLDPERLGNGLAEQEPVDFTASMRQSLEGKLPGAAPSESRQTPPQPQAQPGNARPLEGHGADSRASATRPQDSKSTQAHPREAARAEAHTAGAGGVEGRGPEARGPEARGPEVRAPEVRAPEVRTPEVRTPEVRTPEVRAPEVRAPEVRAPEVRAPEVRAPEVRGPEVRGPEVRTVHTGGEHTAPALLTQSPAAQPATSTPLQGLSTAPIQGPRSQPEHASPQVAIGQQRHSTQPGPGPEAASPSTQAPQNAQPGGPSLAELLETLDLEWRQDITQIAAQNTPAFGVGRPEERRSEVISQVAESLRALLQSAPLSLTAGNAHNHAAVVAENARRESFDREVGERLKRLLAAGTSGASLLSERELASIHAEALRRQLVDRGVLSPNEDLPEA